MWRRRLLGLLVALMVGVVPSCTFIESAARHIFTVSPSDFVKGNADHARQVVWAAEHVREATDALDADRDADPQTVLTHFDSSLIESQNVFDRVNKVLSEAALLKGNDLQNYADEMRAATDEMSKAMVSMRAWIDDRKVSEMAETREHWHNGRDGWNEAVTAIWKAANQAPPPTIPTGEGTTFIYVG